MRPVNLIPPEDRRGDQAPLRTGPLAYIVLGALVAALAGVALLVLTGNQISEREEQLATLKQEDAAATARAVGLASYTQFQGLSEQRVATVQSLADSRFDWERVLRELSLILPRDVALTGLTASGSSEGGAEGGNEGAGVLAGIAGPSLNLTGCARGHDGVARFVTALKDIDGVTRIGLQSSTEAGAEAGSSTEASCGAGAATATFALVVAFDAAPVPLPEGEAGAAPEAEEAAGETSEDAEEPEGG